MGFASASENDFIRYLDRLHEAIEDRDPAFTRDLLQDPNGVHLPREVREEALALSGEAEASFRAPLHLLRYYHRTVQLLRAPAARGVASDAPTQLELELPPPRSHGSLRLPDQARAASRPALD